MRSYFQVPRKYIPTAVAVVEPVTPPPADEPVSAGTGEYRRRIEYASTEFDDLGFSSSSPFILPDQVYLETVNDEHLYYNARSDGRDVYFRDSLGVLLPFEMVAYNAGSARWWILANATVKANRIIYMYYGDHTKSTDNSENIWSSSVDYNNQVVMHSSYHQRDGANTRAINSVEFDGSEYTSGSMQRRDIIEGIQGVLVDVVYRSSCMLCFAYKPACIHDEKLYTTICQIANVTIDTCDDEVVVFYSQGGLDSTDVYKVYNAKMGDYQHLFIIDVYGARRGYDSVGEQETLVTYVGVKHVFYDENTDEISVFRKTVYFSDGPPPLGFAERTTPIEVGMQVNGDEEHTNLSEFRVCVNGMGGEFATTQPVVHTSSDLYYTGPQNDIKSLYAIMFHQDQVRTISSLVCNDKHDELMLV